MNSVAFIHSRTYPLELHSNRECHPKEPILANKTLIYHLKTSLLGI